jgi:(+)-trans-carveol dehydrogenase
MTATDVSSQPAPSARHRFAGHVVWITGAASGMGRRHAERFAAEGAYVGVIDIDADAAQMVADGIRATGARVRAVAADVSDADTLDRAAAQLHAEFGPATVVVANAGVVPGVLATVEDTDPTDWRRVLRVNLTGAFLTARTALPQLREAGGGSLVLVSSAAGLFGFAGYASYVAAKHGVIGLMRSLANEVAGDNIRVNALCPGTTDTPILDREAQALGVSRDALMSAQAHAHLIPRLIEPDEMSDALLWLCSPEAEMVTGVALPVDAGALVKRSLN